MKNFIILFEEKEGTSPLVRLLDQFKDISIVHQVDQAGWEPFDGHNCGPMSLDTLETCLRLAYTTDDFDALNTLYTQTASRPLEALPMGSSRGLKMRFKPPAPNPYSPLLPGLNQLMTLLTARRHQENFESLMFRLFSKLGIVVFLAVRQDNLRWALSRYHGDGSGRPGHLQFRLAGGEINRDDIPRIQVDPKKFSRFVAQCEQSHADKRALRDRLQTCGIQVEVLRYEDFLADKHNYFRRLLAALDLHPGDEQITDALAAGSWFRKVHPDDISGFVLNHEEISERFGNSFVSWPVQE